ncbi:MAG: hypothetical protein QM610_05220 [Chitinophagaceae bacterium]
MATYTVKIDERSQQGKKVLSFLRSSKEVTIHKAEKHINSSEVDKKTKEVFISYSRQRIATQMEKYL